MGLTHFFYNFIKGYGDVTPSTDPGKLLTIVCALFGIPITMLTMKSFGELIHDLVKILVVFVEKQCCRRSKEKALTNLQNKTFLVSLLLMWTLILLGAKMEQLQNGLSLIDGILELLYLFHQLVYFLTVNFGLRIIQGVRKKSTSFN